MSLDPPQTNLAHSPPLCAPVWTHRRQDRLLIRALHALIHPDASDFNLDVFVAFFFYHYYYFHIFFSFECCCVWNCLFFFFLRFSASTFTKVRAKLLNIMANYFYSEGTRLEKNKTKIIRFFFEINSSDDNYKIARVRCSIYIVVFCFFLFFSQRVVLSQISALIKRRSRVIWGLRSHEHNWFGHNSNNVCTCAMWSGPSQYHVPLPHARAVRYGPAVGTFADPLI